MDASLLWWVMIIIALALIAVGIFAWFLFGAGASSDRSPTDRVGGRR